MNDAPNFISILQDQGISLALLPNGNLKVQAPQSVATQELKEQIAVRKSEIIQHLKTRQPLPYLDDGGYLVIPFDSHPRYHWWKGGQSVRKILDGLRN